MTCPCCHHNCDCLLYADMPFPPLWLWPVLLIALAVLVAAGLVFA